VTVEDSLFVSTRHYGVTVKASGGPVSKAPSHTTLNLTTAHALGLTLLRSVLLQATEVIE